MTCLHHLHEVCYAHSGSCGLKHARGAHVSKRRPRQRRGRGSQGVRSTTMRMMARGVFGGEGPRRSTHPGAKWLSVHSSERQPPSLQGRGRRTDKDGDGLRRGRTRGSKRYAECHQAPVRPPSPPVPSGMRGRLRPERELENPTRVAAKAAQPRHESQLRPYVPGRSSLEEMPPVCDGQRFDLLQMHLDARGKRCLHFIEGIAKGRDVEIDADRLPHAAGPIGVTAQGNVQAHRSRRYTGSPSLCQRLGHAGRGMT